MRDGLSHRGCEAGRDQSLERVVNVHRAKHFPDCVLALLSVQGNDGNNSSSEVTEEGLLSVSMRESYYSVEGPVSSKEMVDNAEWEYSGTANHAMRLLTSEFSNHLHGFFGKNTW